MIGFILKNKVILGIGSTVIASIGIYIGIYWWSLTSTITSLEEELALKNQQVIECRQLYQIEQAAVETLVSVIEQENAKVQRLREELDKANRTASDRAKEIIDTANRPRSEGASSPEDMNQWLQDLFN